MEQTRDLYDNEYTELIVPADHLMVCIKHETEDTHLWRYLLTDQEQMAWGVAIDKPEIAGVAYDPRPNRVNGRLYHKVKFKQIFTDTAELIESERANGFYTYKPNRLANPEEAMHEEV